MPRSRDKYQINVLADHDLYYAIEDIALRWGFLHPTGEPNMSRTASVLLAEYISEHDPEVVVGQATEAAKTAVYREIKERMIFHLDQLKKELLEL